MLRQLLGCTNADAAAADADADADADAADAAAVGVGIRVGSTRPRNPTPGAKRTTSSAACMRRLDAGELGPGTVLRGLVRRIVKELEVTSVGEPDDVKSWSN
jgi:hypothetical protein